MNDLPCSNHYESLEINHDSIPDDHEILNNVLSNDQEHVLATRVILSESNSKYSILFPSFLTDTTIAKIKTQLKNSTRSIASYAAGFHLSRFSRSTLLILTVFTVLTLNLSYTSTKIDFSTKQEKHFIKQASLSVASSSANISSTTRQAISAVNGGPIQQKTTHKYVRYECVLGAVCGGWGDRLKGLLSTYALSLILNRTFLIEINHPCDMTTIFRPNQVNWDDDSGLEMLMRKQNFKERIYDFLYNYDFVKYFETDDVIKHMEKYDLISIRTALIYMNNLSKNPFLQKRIQELGYNASRFKLHHLLYDFYHKLFKLNERLERKYEEIKSKIKPTPDCKLICAQIRIGGGIDSRTFSYLNQTQEFWQLIDQYRQKIDSKYMIYVTSDQEQIEQEAKTHFGQEKVFTIDNNNLNLDLQFPYSKDNCSLIEDIILDFHILQLCDVAVVSQSGFGIMGAWNRPIPNQELYVFTNQDSIKNDYWDRKNLSFYKVEVLDDFIFL